MKYKKKSFSVEISTYIVSSVLVLIRCDLACVVAGGVMICGHVAHVLQSFHLSSIFIVILMRSTCMR